LIIKEVRALKDNYKIMRKTIDLYRFVYLRSGWKVSVKGKTSCIFGFKIYIFFSVADPNPDPPDPHVFGRPGSGCGSGSF
jgi:hypothetical protein